MKKSIDYARHKMYDKNGEASRKVLRNNFVE